MPMHREKKGFPRRKVLISAAITVLLMALGPLVVDHLTGPLLLGRLLLPLARLLAVIALGLAVGIWIEATGWTRRLGVVTRPLFQFARLSDHCGAAFSAAFFSGTASNAMLADFHRDRKITTRQLFLTNLLSHFPAYFLHLPTTAFIVLPLTGQAGWIYFLLTFSALLLRCTAFLLCGRWFFRDGNKSSSDFEAPSGPDDKRGADQSILAMMRARLPARLIEIAVFVVPIYTAVFIANALGLFGFIRQGLTGLVVSRFIPLESLSLVVVSFAAEFTSGFATAGALLDSGALTAKQAALALLTGNIIAFPVRALRHQLPRYLGVFPVRLGLHLLLMGQGFRILSLLAVAGIYLWAG